MFAGDTLAASARDEKMLIYIVGRWRPDLFYGIAVKTDNSLLHHAAHLLQRSFPVQA